MDNTRRSTQCARSTSLVCYPSSLRAMSQTRPRCQWFFRLSLCSKTCVLRHSWSQSFASAQMKAFRMFLLSKHHLLHFRISPDNSGCLRHFRFHYRKLSISRSSQLLCWTCVCPAWTSSLPLICRLSIYLWDSRFFTGRWMSLALSCRLLWLLLSSYSEGRNRLALYYQHNWLNWFSWPWTVGRQILWLVTVGCLVIWLAGQYKLFG